MGGREVGGLANQLAAHMGFDAASIDRVKRFWNAPAVATSEGLKAVDLFDAVAGGRVKALWVRATNPAVSLPGADAARAALAKLDLFVISEVVASTDTMAARPHVVLPAAAWGEKDGTVTNSERRISRQRSFLDPPGEAKPDWWIVCEVAKRLGFAKGFDFKVPSEIFQEHARLSSFENDGTRDFDLSGLADLSPCDYAELAPVQWPLRRQRSVGQARLFAKGRFFTPDGRARFIAIARPKLARKVGKRYPYLLNTGRVRDHWHSMTRTGKSPRLSAHADEPYVELHPTDASASGLVDGGVARLSSPHGKVMLRVRLNECQRRGELFAPIHWNNETASDARIGALVHPICDPHSGQPDMKTTPVAIEAASFKVQGILLSRCIVALPDDFWWSRATIDGGNAVRFATNAGAASWPTLARQLLGDDGAIIEFHDHKRAIYRAARIRDERLEACLYLGPGSTPIPGVDWLKRQLLEAKLDAGARKALLAGRPSNGMADNGPVVCACFGVGLAAIQDLIASGAAVSVDAVGQHLKAGTNCGSCQPEIKKLIASTTRAPVLEAAAS